MGRKKNEMWCVPELKDTAAQVHKIKITRGKHSFQQLTKEPAK